MTTENTDTNPNIGTPAADQGAVANPAPVIAPDRPRRRHSTSALVGAGVGGVIVGALGSAATSLFLWVFAFGPPPPPGPMGPGGPQMAWHHGPPPGVGMPPGPMQGGPPPMPGAPGGPAFRFGPPPGMPGAGRPPMAPPPGAPGQGPGGPAAPAPTPPASTPGTPGTPGTPPR
ncbi:hypothetical protein [Mycobacterium szulgai]|uniref:hypothetical protein n=1 Tax=Mycobacterium szulgai TaxID=1787 RepID=UPI001B8000FF|nr:hypothetical protein [Mycobacterium szulgai]